MGLRDNKYYCDRTIEFLGERSTLLDLMLVEKCITLKDIKEQNAILSSPEHGDFYILLQQRLKCMITSCETLDTGMVGEGGDIRSFISINGCNELRAAKLGCYVGQVIQ